jgi:hypothetical protein
MVGTPGPTKDAWRALPVPLAATRVPWNGRLVHWAGSGGKSAAGGTASLHASAVLAADLVEGVGDVAGGGGDRRGCQYSSLTPSFSAIWWSHRS